MARKKKSASTNSKGGKKGSQKTASTPNTDVMQELKKQLIQKLISKL